MSRRQFVSLFMLLAICFVPILINFGVVAWIVPICWGIASTIREVVSLDWRSAIGFGLYSAIYLAVFYLVARVCFFLIGLARHPTAVICLQVAVLLVLCGCSFRRVLTYVSIQGSGGTYTFWTAADRFIEQRSQMSD